MNHSISSQPSAAIHRLFNPVEIYVFVVLLAAGLGNLTAVTGLTEDPVNLSHFIALAGLPVVLLTRRLAAPPAPVMLFFASGLVTSLFAYMFYGIHNENAAQPIYCIILFLLMMTAGSHIPRMQMIKILKAVAVLFLISVCIKNIFYIGEIADSFFSGRRVWVPTLSLGGVNVEATFLVVGAAFMLGSRFFWPYFGFTTFMVLLYSSRANMISLGIILAYYLWLKRKSLSSYHQLTGFMVLVCMSLVAAAVIFMTPLGQYLLLRFGDLGYEPGTETRFLIWSEGFLTLLDHPWGVGAQNGIYFVQSLLANTQIEENLHSIILQYAVDLGIHSLALFVLALIWLARNMPKSMLTHPLTLALITHFSLAISHYSGYETFAYCWFGLWLGQWTQPEREDAHA